MQVNSILRPKGAYLYLMNEYNPYLMPKEGAAFHMQSIQGGLLLLVAIAGVCSQDFFNLEAQDAAYKSLDMQHVRLAKVAEVVFALKVAGGLSHGLDVHVASVYNEVFILSVLCAEPA